MITLKPGALLIGENIDSIEELKGLAYTADVEIIDVFYFNGNKINPAYYIGKGNLSKLENIVINNRIDLIIFNNELSPAQHRNLEDSLNVKVIDRTQLILDIFAGHAHTKESKLQVELAQLEYLLPRLKGKGSEMSRLGGGIGTRGPGETKLEVDRRRIEEKIYRLKNKLKDIKRNREVQRKSRKDPVIALVGYTNVGKSTLMNLLTDANTEVADKLFATLDSTLRRMELPFGKQVILSDTVGFIEKLPHQLVASFRTTLEEIQKADILVHVIDASNPQFEEHIKVVQDVLEELDVLDKKIITVFNKIDLIEQITFTELELRYPDSILISSRTGKGISRLIDKITEIIKNDMVIVQLGLPYSEAHWLDEIHQVGQVYEEKYRSNKIIVNANIPFIMSEKLDKYKLVK